MIDHFLGPNSLTKAFTLASSSGVHGPLIKLGFNTFCQRCKPDSLKSGAVDKGNSHRRSNNNKNKESQRTTTRKKEKEKKSRRKNEHSRHFKQKYNRTTEQQNTHCLPQPPAPPSKNNARYYDRVAATRKQHARTTPDRGQHPLIYFF